MMTTSAGSSSRASTPSSPESLPEDHSAYTSVDLSAWCHSFSPISDTAPWMSQDNPIDCKFQPANLLMLTDIAHERSAYDSPQSPIAIDPSVFQLSQPCPEAKPTLSTNIFTNMPSDNSSCESSGVADIVVRSTPATTTKAVPPPPIQTRKLDSISSHRVIYPAKEQCFNLAILTPSIPLSGTKSRVETQVRVTLDLAQPSCSSDERMSYDRVGSWKWLKLPRGTATRKRSRKEGKIDAAPSDTLFLSVSITCASNPSKEVASCSTCQGREAKRVARKIAARIRPARSDSESNDGLSTSEEASANVIQFNCPDTLDFSSGSVVLPLRITCYCRHHREKVGFNVHFTMSDDTGRVVGKGLSPPIMITDDHKSTGVNATKRPVVSVQESADMDWESRAPLASSSRDAPETGAPSKRRQSAAKEWSAQTKRRAKPYDGTRSATRSRKVSPVEGNESPTVPAQVGNPYPDITALSQYGSSSSSVYTGTAPSSPQPHSDDPISALPSPPNSFPSPTSPHANFFDNADPMIFETLLQSQHYLPPSPPQTAPPSPPSNNILTASLSSAELAALSYPLIPAPEAFASYPPPAIHRLIPSTGPTFGGIEVTILGANFHPSIPYNCVFGDVVATQTTRWSDNTLVCLLPPRAGAGVVPVTLDGFKANDESSSEPVLFTYTDESDRALMALALQVLGLKMTGKVEEAKDIAMRIVGNTTEEVQNDVDVSQMMNLVSASSGNIEQNIIEALTALNRYFANTDNPNAMSSLMSRKSQSGQTMLHLSAFLGYKVLVEFLIEKDVELDARDANGYSALHFSAFGGSQSCAGLLVDAGADMTLADRRGGSPVSAAFFRPLLAQHAQSESDEESQWGDVDDSEVEDLPSRPYSRINRRRVQHAHSRRSSKPSSRHSVVSVDRSPESEEPTNDDDDNATIVATELPTSAPDKTAMDDKTAATFAQFMQRAWAQFQTQQVMPQMPQMPHLPGVPAWAFPVYVPYPAWPPFRAEKNHSHKDTGDAHKDADADDAELRSPTSEMRAGWEKFVMQMSAAAVRQDQLRDAGAKRNTDGAFGPETDSMALRLEPEEAAVKPATSRSLLRRLGYGAVPITDQDVNAYSFRPKSSFVKVKKEDRMLFFFWIPILILAVAWAFYSGVPLAMSMLERHIPAMNRRLPMH